MASPVPQRSRIGLLAAACIFIGIGIGVVWGAQRLINDATQVAHTHEVIGAIDALEARLRDAEATQRGYLLTADPEYLANYRNTRAALPPMRDDLFALVRDNPAQAARAQALWSSIAHRLEQTARTLQRYREGGLPAAQAAITRGVITSSTTIRQQVAAMKRAELQLLAIRAQSTRNSANLLRVLALLGLPIGILVIMAVYQMLVREIRERAHAEGERARANEQLRIGLDRVERGRAELHALNQYGSMLQSCAKPEEALQLTRDLLGNLLPGVGGGIYRIRNSQDHAELAIEWGVASVVTPPMMPVEACWALRRGRLHAAMSADGARCAHLDAPAEGVAATICVPLVAHGAQLGLLTLSDTGDAIHARQDIIQAAAEQLSMSLANLALQDRLRQQSIRDPLTGLFNRRYLEESASRELARCARRDLPLSLLMVDIDHFKSFNDVHGHAGGDAVLTHFGKLLQTMSRGEDIACRYGGEEFTLVLPEANLEVARARAEAIRSAVEAMQVPYLGKLLPPVTVSIGVAAFPVHGHVPDVLMRTADEALYRAKRAGRNRVEIAVVA